MHRPYHSPWWLAGQHLQTIVPAAFMQLPDVPYTRQHLATPDGDLIAVDHIKGNPDAPLVILFHGLEGSAQSHYARRIMAAIHNKGWSGAVVHFRGCAGEPNRLARSYHSGDSSEIDWLLKRFRDTHIGPLYAVGVSLGGNVLLKWLGEQGAQALHLIDKAAAISAPLDLPATGKVLGQGCNRFYSWLFLRTLKPKALEKIKHHQLTLEAASIAAASSLWEYDQHFTAPLHGFRGADDYWHRANCRPHLLQIQVPSLLINARNDPFLPEAYLPTQDELAECITCEFPPHGGHVGFASAHQTEDWLPSRLLCFMETGL